MAHGLLTGLSVNDRLAALEARRSELEAGRMASPAAPIVACTSGMAEHRRVVVARWSTPSALEARDLVRKLIESASDAVAGAQEVRADHTTQNRRPGEPGRRCYCEVGCGSSIWSIPHTVADLRGVVARAPTATIGMDADSVPSRPARCRKEASSFGRRPGRRRRCYSIRDMASVPMILQS